MFDFDLIIIGAGINGAGVARDAAMRGLKVLLLDKGDVGGGTSSGSTRLIHGGLRYLEHGEFGLVRESLRERETLLRIAPHLVRPLPFLLPIYEQARRGPLLLRLGMITYDLLSLGKSLPPHQMLSTAEALARAPGLKQEGLRAAALYYDAQVEFAERLVVENALSAIEHGAQVITYARVSEFIVENDRLAGVEFVKGSNSDRRRATAPVIINAAGPWVDQVIAGVAPASRLIGGTKGSHLIVPRFAGAPDTAIYIEAKTDQRPFFVIPWNGNYLIGTTDRRYDDDLDDVRIDDNEVQYLLSETNAVFPSANLQREEILHSYSGVRTLPFIKETDEQSITRRHFIRPHSRFNNLLSLVGGKLTTYRSLAEETTDLIFAKLGRTSPPCETAKVRLGGASFTGDAPLLTTRLIGIYGGRATAVMALAQNPELAEVFDAETGAIAAEVVYAFEHEFATTLVDCLMRRTMVGLNSTCGLDAVDKAAAIAKKRLGWTDERVEEEIEAYRREVHRRRLHR